MVFCDVFVIQIKKKTIILLYELPEIISNKFVFFFQYVLLGATLLRVTWLSGHIFIIKTVMSYLPEAISNNWMVSGWYFVSRIIVSILLIRLWKKTHSLSRFTICFCEVKVHGSKRLLCSIYRKLADWKSVNLRSVRSGFWFQVEFLIKFCIAFK